MKKELSELLFPNITKDINYYLEMYPRRDVSDKAIITRFAPSPTGFIHIGSLYTAFICNQFAKDTNGVYFLRIEDTDQKRKIDDGINLMLNDLKKFNINFDEGPDIGGIYGPYIQSERREIYQTFAKDLISKGLAYPCFMSEEEIKEIREKQSDNKERIGIYGKYAKDRDLSYDEVKKRIDNGMPYIIRLRSTGDESKRIAYHDLIKGNIEFPENDMDIVLIKSDGLPTYHFAHVIDDYLMGTTHVIRGEEWLSSVPVHLELFKVLNFKTPKYGHLSPLTKKDGNSVRKLSKRYDKECAMKYYEELGIPSEALSIYFATLINANFEPWYMQNKDSRVEDYKFEFSKMKSGGTLFDLEKLKSICKLYFSRKTAESLYDEVLEYTKSYDKEFYDILLNDREYAIKVFNIERNKAKPRKDIAAYSDVRRETSYMFNDLFMYDGDMDYSKYDGEVLVDYINNIYDINDSHDEWYDKLSDYAYSVGYVKSSKEYNLDPTNYKGHIGTFCEMLRVALTGRLQTPDLYEIMAVLGIDEIKSRLNKFMNI